MKKLLLSAIVLALAFTAVGCGPAPTTKASGGVSATGKTEETKKQ